MKCIIIDDEPIARKGLKRLVDSRHELQLAAMLDSAESAARWLGENDADLIFLDIEMPGANGIEFARDIAKGHMVVFTTAYADYAIDGYDVEAIDYIMKPVDPARFNKAVDRAVAYKALLDEARDDPEETHDFIIVKADRRYVRVRLADILYVEGLKDYLIIHMTDRRVVTRMTVKAMEDLLPDNVFLRIGKSYIINKDKVDSFDSNDIFIGDTEISIGLPWKESVINALLG